MSVVGETVGVIQNVRNRAHERLQDVGESVVERVVTQLVDQEVTRRTEILSSALETRDILIARVNGMRPDQTTIDGQGREQVAWSKKKYDEKIAADKAVDDLDAAIEKAIDKNATRGDWDAVQKIVDKALKK